MHSGSVDTSPVHNHQLSFGTEMSVFKLLKFWVIVFFHGVLLIEGMDVVIIGAGISGISAGRHLINHGGYNVTILEARPDRYGGRMWTNKQAFPNATGCEVEMGAAWIHGMNDKNPITQIQKKLRLATFATDYDNQVVYSYATGGEYSEDKIAEAWQEHEMVESKIFTAASNYEQDISYEEALRKEGFADWLNNSPLHQFTMTSEAEAIEGAPLANISVKRYNPTAATEGFSGDDSLVVEGYTQILDGLVNGIETQEKKLNIQLNKEVTHIQIKPNEKKVLVQTKAGERYTSDVVVVTVPLGVLKADVINFSPPLPDDFQQAVRQVGFGVVNKLILEFDEIFWPADKQVIGIAGDDDASKRGLFWVWFNMYPVVKRPVLIGFIDGNGAIVGESLTKQEMINIALKKLRKVFGDSVVNSRRIVQSERSQWGSDPFARGSYSFAAVGNTIDMHKTLASSVCPYIHFAGEHTIPEYIGNVHGAYISGVRAAQKITKETMCQTNVSTAATLCTTIMWMALCLILSLAQVLSM